MSVKKIILVFKTHFDIGFTRLARDILKYYEGRMMDQVETTCRATAQMGDLKYVWTMPAWPLAHILEHADADRVARIDALVRNGQLNWHALPYTSHYDFSGVEDAVHGLSYARTLCERYGLPPRHAAKMTDVPGFGWFLPELLAGAGIDFLHLGSNEFASVPDVPPLFWWEAPSGRRVLTMYNAGYGTSLLPPRDWPHETWLALMNTEDNAGPQSAQIVARFVEKIRSRLPEAEVVCGALEDFRNALFEEDLSDVPVVRKDLADTWIHGVASYPRESAAIRRLRGRLVRAERALALRGDAALTARALPELRRAWDDVALYDEHTWGLDVKTFLGTIPDYDDFESFRRGNPRCARMEASWREQSARAERAAKACARVEKRLGLQPTKARETVDYFPASGEQTLENDRFRVELDADAGVVRSVYDKRHCLPMLAARDGAGVFSYRYDVYGIEEMTEFLRAYGHRFTHWGVLDYGRVGYPECEHRTRLPRFVGCERRDGAVRLRYRPEETKPFGDAREVTIELVLPAGEAPLRVRVTLAGKRATPYVESASLCVPLAADAPAWLLNKTGCVLRPESRIADGANHAFYAMEHFIAADDGHALLGIVSHDCALVSLGENGVFRYRRAYAPTRPEFRFCLLNNMWGTNFPQWIEGDMAFEFDVLAEDSGAIGALYKTASSLAENPDGLEDIPVPFSVSGPVRVTRVVPFGEGTLVRLHNCDAASCVASIRQPGWDFVAADLLGVPQGRRKRDRIEFDLAPFGMQTCVATPRKPQ